MKSRHLLTEIRTMQEKGILHPNDVYIWLLMAMTELDQGDSVAFSPDELSRATGLSRSSVFRSIKRMRAQCLCDTQSVRLTPRYSVRGTLSVRETLTETAKKPRSHDNSASNAKAHAECPNDTAAPFSPHTPLNPKRNNIYSTYSSLNEERNEEENVRIERERKVTEKKRKAPQKPRIEREHYAEFVTLTKQEYDRLVERYGEAPTKRMIEILDNYKGATGKKYDCDYRAILNWVVKRYEEEQSRPHAASADKRATDQHYARNSMDFFAEGFDI